MLGFAFTPVLADVLAIWQLYGLSTTTRTDDTTYGTHSNSERRIHGAEYAQYGSVTIFDSGGINTINYSGMPYDQRIDLRPAMFSNVGGGIGNLSISHGVLIENAMGGDGNDVLIGNGADNRLEGVRATTGWRVQPAPTP